MRPVRDRVRARFEVDARSLAAVRIALGVILLIDLIHRAGDIELFYTDNGAYPFTAYELTYTQYNGLSLHALSGDLWFQQLLFVCAGLFAVAFVLGYRTRLVGAVSFVLMVSLHARNPAVLNGGDRLFLVLFFVALVAPIGERWSIDALRRGSARTAIASFGTAALLVQPLVVFTANAIKKHAGDTWYAGEALQIAMANDTMTVLLGNVIADYPTLLTALNYGWVTLLSGSVLFLLLPVGRVRMVAALVYIGAFLGMITSMTVGLFPLVLSASILPFLPGRFWDALARRVPAEWVDRLPSSADFGPLGRRPLEQRLFDALRARGHEGGVSYALAYGRSLLTVAGFMVFVWILVFAAADVTEHDVPAQIDHEHLDQQRWGLYAPNPSSSYSWYIPAAELADGSTIDARHGDSVSFDRPPDASKEYDTFRHRKFLQAVRSSDGGSISQGYADWMCRQAADHTDETVERVTVYRMIQPSPVNGEFDSDPTRRTVIEYDCRERSPV
ncbi:HTTM domain-containing protein [Halorubrum sp. DTA46]|uniref:HTTM domain-containing protein n=1 Tax=Halorubrum sp. DTA46 TaxID=3402162 RepID=UPI003AAC3FA1